MTTDQQADRLAEEAKTWISQVCIAAHRRSPAQTKVAVEALEAFIEALATLARTPSVPDDVAAKWQTIETAPKDGTAIWVIDIGALRPEAGPAHWSGSSWHAGTLSDWLDIENAHEKWGYWPSPTHWMPLPEPPTAARASHEGEQP